VLTLAQTHKLAKKITVVIYGSDYWKSVFNFQKLVDTGAISPRDMDLLKFADTPEEAFELLRHGLTEDYLRPEALLREKQPAAAGPAMSVEDLMGPEFAKTSL